MKPRGDLPVDENGDKACKSVIGTSRESMPGGIPDNGYPSLIHAGSEYRVQPCRQYDLRKIGHEVILPRIWN